MTIASQSQPNNGSTALIHHVDVNEKTNSTVSNDSKKVINFEPPDGGLRAWSVLIGSFLINGVLFGIINNNSHVNLSLKKAWTLQYGEAEAGKMASLVTALQLGTTFLLSPIVGMLTNRIGIRLTTFIGGGVAATGMLLSSFLINQGLYLSITYGFMYGIGSSLAYTPSLVILGHYFKRRLGLANGIVTMGSSLFTAIFSFTIEASIDRYELKKTLIFMAAITASLMLCAILFKPTLADQPDEDEEMRQKNTLYKMLQQVFKVSIWKKKKYVIWACAMPITLFGYLVPYIHIGNYIEKTFPDQSKALPIMCCGITSGIGRLLFGFMADSPKVNRILLQQISFVCLGILSMLIPLAESYIILIFIMLGMGLFDGCFISLLGPIAFDICGHQEAAQAIGFLLGACSISIVAGPPIAEAIQNATGSYNYSFMLGGTAIIGAILMCLMHRVNDKPTERQKDTEIARNGLFELRKTNEDDQQISSNQNTI